MKRRILIVALCFICAASFGQTNTTPPPATTPATAQAKPFDRPDDGYYKKRSIINAKVVPLPQIREADIVYSRRIWREIDVRETMNRYMASPKGRLIDALMDAVSKGELTAYDPTSTTDDPGGDKFTMPLTAAKAKARM